MELLGPFAIVLACVLAITAWLTRVAGYSAAEPAIPQRRATDAPARAWNQLTLPPQWPAPPCLSIGRDRLSITDANRLLVADAQGLPPLRVQEHGGVLWLVEVTSGKLVGIGDARLPALGIWSIWLRAVDSRTILAREGLLHSGAALRLVRQPRNAADSNAIAVHSVTGRLVGYVSPRIAAGLAAVLDAGTSIDAVVVSFSSRSGSSQPGLITLLAASPQTLSHLFEPVSSHGTVQMSLPDELLTG
ncbi:MULTISPECIES: HIRAN domain-containing protein [Cryobacterium]|nr:MULTISPECIES: HIRAN domain-containing protein [Cryobacterium]